MLARQTYTIFPDVEHTWGCFGVVNWDFREEMKYSVPLWTLPWSQSTVPTTPVLAPPSNSLDHRQKPEVRLSLECPRGTMVGVHMEPGHAVQKCQHCHFLEMWPTTRYSTSLASVASSIDGDNYIHLSMFWWGLRNNKYIKGLSWSLIHSRCSIHSRPLVLPYQFSFHCLPPFPSVPFLILSHVQLTRTEVLLHKQSVTAQSLPVLGVFAFWKVNPKALKIPTSSAVMASGVSIWQMWTSPWHGQPQNHMIVDSLSRKPPFRLQGLILSPVPETPSPACLASALPALDDAQDPGGRGLACAVPVFTCLLVSFSPRIPQGMAAMGEVTFRDTCLEAENSFINHVRSMLY